MLESCSPCFDLCVSHFRSSISGLFLLYICYCAFNVQ